MKNLFILHLLFTFIGFELLAEPLKVSAVRAAGQAWSKALESVAAGPQSALNQRHRAHIFNTRFQNVGGIPEWTGTLEELNTLNEKSFQVRPYQNPNPGSYLRRAPWMFPADGCYARAAHVSALAQKMNYVAPGKVFAFGDLRFRSDYANGGIVYWSYHVVSSYHIDGQVYVIDPIVSRSHPAAQGAVMTLSQWMEQISPRPESLEIALCDAQAYTPASECIGSRGNGAYLGHINDLLQDEYQNLKSVGLEPDLVLGSN